MTSFTSYDFSESMGRADGFKMSDIDRAVAAWGENGDYNEWSGGFLLLLKDGRFAYLEGWCDTTGWGCQDGAETTMFDEKPQLEGLATVGSYAGAHEPEWDTVVADLNRLIRGEIKEFDES